jgi:NAD(P)-dependent dehydrogenase (short-subunit alcohol dehydrogenase family)
LTVDSSVECIKIKIEGISMQSVIITGANVGIGFATASYLANDPNCHVILACRNSQKAAEALKEIRQKSPSASVSTLSLDLLSLRSIRDFVASLEGQNLPPIRGLILNAGGINMRAKVPEFSEDGFECTFQLNFFGHFVLTSSLINRLEAPARVVFVSSDLHDPAATKMGKIMPPRFGPVADAAYGRGLFAKMKPMARYGTAKMFAMMCAREFDRRLEALGRANLVTVNSWSPGVVPTTQAGRGTPVLLKMIMMSGAFVRFMGSHLSTEDDAARALGRLMIDPNFAGVSGRYFDGFKEIPSSAESRDETKAKTVWEQARSLGRITLAETGLP